MNDTSRVVVSVTDELDRTLTGRDGHHYLSPPQSADNALVLVALLLGHTSPPNIADAGEGCLGWRRPVAGGQRTITVYPAPQPPDQEASHAQPRPPPTTSGCRGQPSRAADDQITRPAHDLHERHQQQLALGAQLTSVSLRRLLDSEPQIQTVTAQIEARFDDGVGETVSLYATFEDGGQEHVDVEYWTVETVRQAFGLDANVSEGQLTRQPIHRRASRRR